MSKTLVIVESPAKAKTIKKFLGRNYSVVASMGHVRDLPKSQFGIDRENDYEVKYITIRGKGPINASLKKEAAKHDHVLLASDPDREGEAIAWHLKFLLGIDDDEKCRVTFNEITKNAVRDAVKGARVVNQDLVDAQQARRVLDRIVGYELSPLLWRKVKKGLSAGRVQSVALRLICEREDEIRKFEPEEYWSLTAELLNEKKKNFEAKLTKKDNKKIEVKNKAAMDAILADLEGAEYQVTEILKKPRRRNAPLPFTTSTLQQDASRRLGFTAKRTMRIAQGLYEGVNLGKGGTTGLITYMRTDSNRISEQAQAAAKILIADRYGKEFVGQSGGRAIGKKTVEAQDAHEAIRPTDVSRTPESLESVLSPEQMKLYRLIWTRFVASQMSAAKLEQTTASIQAKNYTFSATGSVIVFNGYLHVYDENQESGKKKAAISILPALFDGEIVSLNELKPDQHFTQPPARYNEASLIKTMEENGIGRPSTYVAVIETLNARNYISREKKQFYPTEIGELVNELLVEHFGDIIDVDFTARFETELDEVASGERQWKTVIRDFDSVFQKELEKAEEVIGDVKIEDEVTDIICEKCGKPFLIKMGRFGKFLACSGFPDCRNTRPLLEKIGVKCPSCDDGEIVLRRSRKGRVFYGCSNYPECDFVSWNKPTGEICPQCKKDFLVEKETRKGKQILCNDTKTCGYKQDIQEDGHE